jgi:hypothetical protein
MPRQFKRSILIAVSFTLDLALGEEIGDVSGGASAIRL